MGYIIHKKDNSEEFIEKFIALPKALYNKNELTQSENEERALLTGKHILSHYFSFKGLMVADEKGTIICRCAITIYPDDKTAYMGFFESYDNVEAVKLLFETAEELAKEAGAVSILGPVDASFWIKYRLKTNHFGKPYTGEPYNLPYYLKLWQECGYNVTEQYYSNHYKKIENKVDSEKFSKRLTDKLSEGYVIKNVSKKDFDRVLKEVYKMLIELYAVFPAYKRITEEEFISQYSYFKSIINCSMVKMAYYMDTPVGFHISIPDYGNTVYGKLGISDYVKILINRTRPRSYVMLYMGVDKAHRGLGRAIAEAVRMELRKKAVPSIGALIRKGSFTKNYFPALIDYEYEYVLLEKQL